MMTGRSHSFRASMTPEGLAQIHEPGVELVVWERRLPGALVQWLDGLDPSQLPHTRFFTSPQDAARALDEHLSSCSVDGAIDDHNRQMQGLWIEEMAALVGIFAGLMGNETPRVRLDHIRTDGCRKFHVDTMTVRLLCTYIGQGTQWLSASEQPKHPRDDDNQPDPDGIHHLPRFAVGLYKGNRHPTHQPDIYHRSPPLGPSGQSRFVLCIDDFAPRQRPPRLLK